MTPLNFSPPVIDDATIAAIPGAHRHGQRVIQDGALMQGSTWKGRPVGSFADIATFSFHPNKKQIAFDGHSSCLVNVNR